jgi:hypothetical protein
MIPPNSGGQKDPRRRAEGKNACGQKKMFSSKRSQEIVFGYSAPRYEFVLKYKFIPATPATAVGET